MDYDELLDLTVDLAYQLQQCGAETYRVEETIVRLLGAYGVEGSAFSIPGCIIVSLETAEEKHMTRMHRAAYSSTDLDGIERYSGLCRRICQEKPPVQEAMAMIQAEKQATKSYRFPTLLMGYFLAAAGFSMFFRGTLLDALCAGLSGLATGLCLYFMNKLHANLFFKTVAAGFVLALLAHGLAIAGLAHNVDAAIIGALMLLVPGLLFTNSIRDIIYGDTMSGVNRLVQVLITAVGGGDRRSCNPGAAAVGRPGRQRRTGPIRPVYAMFCRLCGKPGLLHSPEPSRPRHVPVHCRQYPQLAGLPAVWIFRDVRPHRLPPLRRHHLRLRRDHGPDSEMPRHLLSSGGPLPSGPRCRHLLHHGLCRPR